MKVKVLTLFPEMFKALTESGISGRALDRGHMQLGLVNPREFSTDRHRTVDDKPYGGGPGMVMMVEPLSEALNQAQRDLEQPAHVVCLSPQGRQLCQSDIERLGAIENLILVCGRYEGIDERFIESSVDEEISVGDFVVSGGEIPAMLLLDAIIRQLPGALGSDLSAGQDSYAGDGLLDYPHYTRPEVVDGLSVPAVLLSGDHAKIAAWRREQSLYRTVLRRPDLLEEAVLEEGDQAFIDSVLSQSSKK